MNSQQYRQMLRNGRARCAAALFHDARDARLLRRAAAALRKREGLAGALARALPEVLAANVRICSLRAGLLTLEVDGAAAAGRIRAQAARLAAELRRFAPGVQRLRVVLAGDRGSGEEAGEG